jgi:aminoglycoside adenylyltransferase-like protein/nucleotidyltransferase-like protein
VPGSAGRGPAVAGSVRAMCGRGEATPRIRASRRRTGPYSRGMAEPAEVLARLAAELAEVLGDDLLSLALHGSLALGDFAPGRSDLDLFAVVATDPTAATLAGLKDVHIRLDTEFPEWKGHVEVDYVSVEAVEAVLQGTDESHPMIRISPGEPLHEVEVSRHYVLNWAAALQADQTLAGAAPSTVLPAIDRRLIHQVVLEHVRAWPEWVQNMQTTGAQAYAVLTLCRAAEALATGRQVSKLAAAKAARSRFREWSALIDWAQNWWYHGGSDLDHGRFEDVRRFVKDLSARSLRHYAILPDFDGARNPIAP